MVDVVAKARQLFAEIILRDKTGEGAASAAANFEKIGVAAEETAQKAGAATEETGKRTRQTVKDTQSAERALARLQKTYDPLVRLEAKRTADLERLNRVMAFRKEQDGEYAALQQRINTNYDRQVERIRAAEQAQRHQTESVKASENAQRRLNGVTSELGPIFNRLKGVVAGFFAAFTLHRLISETRQAIAAFGDLADKAKSIGGIENAGFLQEARAALGQQGFDKEGVDQLLGTFNRNLGQLELGRGRFATTLTQISGGRELADQLKAAGSLREQYELMIDALSHIEDANKRAAIAAAAFGAEAGEKIAAAAEEGVAGFRALAASAVETGQKVEDFLIGRADRLDDSLAQSANIADTQLKRALLALGPILKELARLGANILKGFADNLITGQITGFSPEDIRRLGDIDEVSALKAAADEAIAREEEKLRKREAIFRDRQVSVGEFSGLVTAGISARVTGIDPDGSANLAVLRRNAELFAQQIAHLETAPTTVKDLEEALGGAGASLSATGAAAADFGDGFGEALEKPLDEVLKLKSEVAALEKALAAPLTGRVEIEQARRAAAITAELDRLEEQAAKNLQPFDRARTGELYKQRDALQDQVRLAADLAEIGRNVSDLREEAAIAGLPELEREAAEDRLEIERKIRALRDQAAVEGNGFDEAAARVALEEEKALERIIEKRRELARDLDAVADDFIDRIARGDPSAFRNLGRQLRDILFDTVLDPFKNAFANLLRNLLSGVGAGFNPLSIFGFGGGASGASIGGLPTVSTPYGSFPAGVGGGAGGGNGVLGLGGGVIGGLASAAGAGFFGFGAGQAFSNLLGLKKGSNIRPIVTGAVGGAVGGAAAGALAFGAAGAPALTAIGLGAAAGGPIGLAIGLIAGGLIALFGNKPSNKTGQIVFDPSTGRVIGTGQKDASEDSNRNLDIARTISEAISEGVTGIAKLTGASLGGFLANVDVGNVRGIGIGEQGPRGESLGRVQFENTEEGAKAAIAEGIRRSIERLEGGDDALVAVVKQLAAADEPLEMMLERVEKVAAALDQFKDEVDPAKERLSSLLDAFEGLDRSTGALKSAFDKAIASLAANENRANREALEAIENPRLAETRDLAEQLARRGAALAEINAEGGNVDLSLFNELARRQLLGGFNIEQRLAQGADPAAASVAAFRAQQGQELEALKSIVGQFGVTQADVASLIRAQRFERLAFFKTLPEEDRLRLSGQADDFENLEGRYGRAVEKLLDHSKRLTDGFEERAAELEGVVADRAAGVETYAQKIRDLDRAFGQGSPARRLDIQRADVQDLASRALADEDTADRRLARTLLPQAVEDFVLRSQQVNASGPEAQADFLFGRDILDRVRAAQEAEGAAAQKELDVLLESRDLLEKAVDLLAEPQLDAEAFAKAIAALPAGFSGREDVLALAREVLVIQDAIFEQNERIAAALEALAPEDVGLSAPDTVAPFAADAATPPAYTPTNAGGSAALQTAQTATPGGGSTEVSQEADIQQGLYQVSKRLDLIAKQDSEYYQAQKRRDDRADSKLNRIANK